MKTRIASTSLLILALAIACPSAGHADLLSLSNGTATFTWDPNSGAANSTFLAGSISGGANNMFAFNPLIRNAGTTTNPGIGFAGTRNFSDAAVGGVGTAGFVTSVAGNVVTNNLTYNAGAGFGGVVNILSIVQTFDLQTDLFDNAILTWDTTVTNVNPFGNTLAGVELFGIFDLDIPAFGSNTGVADAREGFTGILQGTTNDPFSNVFAGTDNFQSWQVSNPNAALLGNVLAGGALTNGTVPFGPADTGIGLGWNIGNMAPGASFTVTQYMATVVPEPGTTAALAIGTLALVGVCIRRRRRR